MMRYQDLADAELGAKWGTGMPFQSLPYRNFHHVSVYHELVTMPVRHPTVLIPIPLCSLKLLSEKKKKKRKPFLPLTNMHINSHK